jgi:carboxylesterase type B
MKWVQNNIAAFEVIQNVTIFGESAGGVSVHSSLQSLCKSLFQRQSSSRVVTVMVFSPADPFVLKMQIPLSHFVRND